VLFRRNILAHLWTTKRRTASLSWEAF
jgi:hypothetical protein